MSHCEIIGIDLGTTNSLCSVFKDGNSVLVPNALGETITPSVVGLLRDGQLVVGQSAAELRVSHPLKTASCFKRWMGLEKELLLGDRKFTPIELSSVVLRSLRRDAEVFLGQEVTDAVITVPAYFNDNQRKATKQAGKLAGLNVRRIINEPTAAALAYGFHDRESEKKIIVVDLGGGTFDVTIMEIFEGTLEIVSTAGITQMGGEDFTNRMVAWVLQRKDLHLEQEEIKHPQFVARIREQCEMAKRELQVSDQFEITIPEFDGRFPESPQKLTVQANQCDDMFGSLIEQLTLPISKALRDSRLNPDELDEVILVGGATREKNVQNHVFKLFQKEPHHNIDPDTAVAIGAGVQAALIVDDQSVEDIVMTDVCPFTLGIEITKQIGSNQFSGYYNPIIHRNTTIPVSREEVFSTIYPNQREVSINVYQGESRKVEGNLFLGNLLVKNIPPGPEGTPFYVRFTYDLNGILEVEAFVNEKSKKYRAVLTNNVSGLSEDEIQLAVKKMEDLKFYPREDLENQQLLLFAEKSVGEVSPFQREGLETIIDQFEIAMQSGEKDFFEVMKQQLIIKLSELDLHWNFKGRDLDDDEGHRDEQ